MILQAKGQSLRVFETKEIKKKYVFGSKGDRKGRIFKNTYWGDS